MSMTNYAAVSFARYEEEELKRQGKPYSDAVIHICDWFINETVPAPQFSVLSVPKESDHEG